MLSHLKSAFSWPSFLFISLSQQQQQHSIVVFDRTPLWACCPVQTSAQIGCCTTIQNFQSKKLYCKMSLYIFWIYLIVKCYQNAQTLTCPQIWNMIFQKWGGMVKGCLELFRKCIRFSSTGFPLKTPTPMDIGQYTFELRAFFRCTPPTYVKRRTRCQMNECSECLESWECTASDCAAQVRR